MNTWEPKIHEKLPISQHIDRQDLATSVHGEAVRKGGFTTEAQRTQRIGIDLNLGQVGVAARRSPNSETPDDRQTPHDRTNREDEKELENEGFANC